MRITAHAIARYQQRIAPVDADKAHAVIAAAERSIDVVAGFGCDTVVLGCGTRLKLAGDVVCTVYEKRYGRRPRCLS